MVVQHNITAMNANRMLGVTTGMQAKSSEKLSSGFKINRAADDAAGLTISEKMRKQIRGLDQASTNASDGVSAVQTAEGALTEVHSMLQRMNELAVQAANGTNSKDDREAIQAEIDQLTTEIDRVAETTKFNETYLLKGTDATSGTTTKAITLNVHDAGIKGQMAEKPAADGSYTFKIENFGEGKTVSIAGQTFKINSTNTKTDGSEVNLATAKDLVARALREANEIGGATPQIGTVGDDGEVKVTPGTVTVAKALQFNLHVGADADMTNKIGVEIETMTSRYLGVEGIDVVGKDDAVGGTTATYAIDAIADAVAKVSAQRSALGAIQNRLEHTIANLDNVVENTTAAESRIRDTDMAKEMVTYSKNNILAQAGQSMLAQANQSNQGVMSLLQ
ncbi:MAG: flagellin [Lachnospiraceae bacterium]|jgi:flagellin|nr:flagellin [Lachnospiraceae bacterium]